MKCIFHQQNGKILSIVVSNDGESEEVNIILHCW